jgi:hypothetical protein
MVHLQSLSLSQKKSVLFVLVVFAGATVLIYGGLLFNGHI